MYIVISISFFYRMAGLRISKKRNHRNRLSGEFGCRCDPCKIKYKICKTRIHGYRSLGFLFPIATNYLSIKNITKPFIEKNFRIFLFPVCSPLRSGRSHRSVKPGCLSSLPHNRNTASFDPLSASAEVSDVIRIRIRSEITAPKYFMPR